MCGIKNKAFYIYLTYILYAHILIYNCSGRFRRLCFIDQHEAETMTHTAVAACIMHNICILQEDLVDALEEDEPEDALPPQGAGDGDNAINGAVKRNRIMNRL